MFDDAGVLVDVVKWDGAAEYAVPFAFAKFNGANVDIRRVVAGQNASPASFIAEHADRITHLHIKDRRLNRGPNACSARATRRFARSRN